MRNFLTAVTLCLTMLPGATLAEVYLHYTRILHVTEQQFPTLRNDLILRTYGKGKNGYIIPVGYRIVRQTSNVCVHEVPEDLLTLVQQVFDSSEPRTSYSGANIMAKLKVGGVDMFTITRQREIVNSQYLVREMLPGDYDFLAEHFMTVAESNPC